MQRYDRTVGDCLSLAVRQSPDGPLLGEAVLYHFTLNGGAEVGCRILPEYQGKGLGKRAFARAARLAAEQGAKPNARCYRENTVSRKMIEAAGFVMTREDAAFYYFAPSVELENTAARAHRTGQVER